MNRLLLPFIVTATMASTCGASPYLATVESPALPPELGTYALDVSLTLTPPQHRFLKIGAHTRVSDRRELRLDAGFDARWSCDGEEHGDAYSFECGWRDVCEVRCEMRITRIEEHPRDGQTFLVYLMSFDGEEEYRGKTATLTLGEWRTVQP